MHSDSEHNGKHEPSQRRELETLLGLIVEHAVGVCGGERGFLVLEERGELRLDAARDRSRGEIARHELELASSAVREALANARPVHGEGGHAGAANGRPIAILTLARRSILCVPFEIGRDAHGAICIDHGSDRRVLDDHAEHVCRMLADQAALTIRQVKSLEELRALNHELERRVTEKDLALQNARRALRETVPSEPGVIPIAELEKRAIHSALEQTGGDKRRAAELLGISRAKIYQRLKDWAEGKVDEPQDRARGEAGMAASL